MINLRFLIVLFLLFNGYCSIAGGKGYKIKFKINGLKDTTLYIGNHYGDKQYIRDTVRVDGLGNFVMEGDDDIEGGIYFVLNGEKSMLFEFFISEKFFSIETDSKDYLNNMKIKGSEENIIFNNFNKFFAANRKIITDLEKQKQKYQNNKDSVDAISERLKIQNKKIQDYMEDVIKKNPKSLLTKIFLVNKPVDIPEAPEGDSTFALRYHQKHYFDFVDFSDERLLRTPVFHGKIYTYLDRLTYPFPDSIKVSAERICELSRVNKNVFRYVVSNLTYYYETSKYMGMDEVFVHLADKYYLSGEAWWADTTIVRKIKERVDKIRPTLIGEIAYDVNFVDTSLRKTYSIHGVQADYTIVFLFDPDCGHCKKMTDTLQMNYDTLKMLGAEIYAINTQPEIDKWKKYVKEKKIKWINVGPTSNEYRDYYDVYSTPILYLLDKEKRIMAKRIGVGQLKDIIRRDIKRKKEKKG